MILVPTAVWCVAYGLMSLAWALGAPGFPFGDGDSRGREMGSLLASAHPVPTGVALGCGALIAAATAVWAMRRPGRAPGVVLLVCAAALLAVVPDVRLLQNLAYSFSGFFGLVDRPVLNQALCVLGAGLLARSAVVLLRPAAVDAGRWLTIGRWATLVAVLAPLPYALQRAAWNLGLPLGVSQRFVDDLAADVAAKGLPAAAAWMLVIPDVVGVLLTLGLIMRWGERFPRWVPLRGGRSVPVWLAVVPASVVSAAVTIAGLVVIRFAVEGGSVSATAAPGLLWLPWGLALGVATYAYAERRRDSESSTNRTTVGAVSTNRAD
ncbi:hypothetical protein CryarDRAFT_1908 [Cryptosporangium arvum DSM 44712]|uniref:Uncharacterized protein n=2 Tax=Cryptosporangium TaxID=65502 RepID=A0A010Z041_9ACTN|nr:hypothetical protein CryarDRAFT_1908 [Cryptosporangium arvum DSM 44712]